MDRKITIYIKDGCQQCRATERALDARGFAYNVINVSRDDAAREQLVAAGYQQMPVVMVGDNGLVWTGFRPDIIKKLAESDEI